MMIAAIIPSPPRDVYKRQGLSGYLATVSWQGAVLSVVCAIVAFLIWFPFIKHYDNVLLKKEQAGAAKN